VQGDVVDGHPAEAGAAGEPFEGGVARAEPVGGQRRRARCQIGDDLVYVANGLLKLGLVIRLLVLPNDIGSVRESLEWIREALSPRVAVSLMAQYYPTNVAGTNPRYTLLSRRIRETEWMRAVSALDELGMQEGWMQEFDGAAFYYRPNFDDADTPFRDIRDFR
jgi:putative pyruvate formate lyase activating enzyme